MKVSFSLAGKAKPAPTGTAPPLKQPTAFASLDDDAVDAAPTASTSRDVEANKALAAKAAGVSRTMKKRIEQERRVDETVYEYDEVWDKMQEAKLRQKEKEEEEAKERKPKYISNLLQMATTRKLDYWRAEEKKYQRERETEGEEFADKEQFVTQAYKDQMEQVRQAEEEEKKREELEKKKGRSTGLAHLYRQLLEQNDEQHTATVAATQAHPPKKIFGAALPPVQNLTITKPPDFTPPSDLELAARARAEGKDVELNDDNQIVDKRALLSAGLNLSAPNTRRLGGPRARASAGAPAGGAEPAQVHTAVGSAASRREINERRQREVEQQLAEEQERARGVAEEREREQERRNVAKRNTEEDVKSARERYLERKRRRLEEGATANSDDARVDVGGGS